MDTAPAEATEIEVTDAMRKEGARIMAEFFDALNDEITESVAEDVYLAMQRLCVCRRD